MRLDARDDGDDVERADTSTAHGAADTAVSLVSMDVVRRLARVSSRIGSGSVLADTLDAVASGIVDVLGFGVAVVNHRRPDGDFEAVAIAGRAEAREAMLGAVAPRESMAELLHDTVAWGTLRYQSHDRDRPVNPDYEWVPNTDPCDDADAWHPLDLLLAPMHAEDGELVGIISVDLPPDGRRPSRVLCELLELFAMQAGIAIAAVELRERYDDERLAREALLHDLAYRDALTGLPNRRALDAALRESVRRARSQRRSGALLFCDLDGLKRVNDREGHARGDEALIASARELQTRVREGDLVCRVGGDEFVVVADGLSPTEARAMAARLRDDRQVAGIEHVSLSVGIAIIDGTRGASELLALADAAMYADKAGRQRLGA